MKQEVERLKLNIPHIAVCTSHVTDEYLNSIKKILDNRIHPRQFTGHHIGEFRVIHDYDVAQDEYWIRFDVFTIPKKNITNGECKLSEVQQAGMYVQPYLRKGLSKKKLRVVLRKLRKAVKKSIR